MEKLYLESVKTVYGFLYSLCGDRELANDLTQETFLKAFESLDRYNGACKFTVWLCQIGRHLWYQHLEKSKRERPVGDDIYTLADGGRVGMAAEDEAIQGQEIRDISLLISKMPKMVSEVLVLRLFYEYSFKEIGYILGRSENWSRVTFFRGKEKLMGLWEERYGK